MNNPAYDEFINLNVRHKLTDKVLENYANGQLTMVELSEQLTVVINENPCDCLECSE